MQKLSIRCFGVLLALCFLVSGAAIADDIYTPSWRGSDGTTLENWAFTTSANPAAPDTVNNSYGSPTATMTVLDYGVGWIDADSFSYGTKTGMWDLGASGIISLDIPNRPLALSYKDIWVQVTYLYDPFEAPVVSIAGAQYLGGESQVVETLDGFGQWVTAVSKWRITPNPSSEVVTITADAAMGSLIDSVIVDTKCVPEPASMVTLLAGGLGLLISRRRRK